MQTITTRFKKLKPIRHDNRGVSTVIAAMLGLVLIVIVVGNVFLINFQMNQLDWEKMQEKITINNNITINGTDSFYVSQYNLLDSTSWIHGTISDLAQDYGISMSFNSYHSGADTSDYVDNNISNLDSNNNVGTHSNFTAQQVGPDAVDDVLTETKTALDASTSTFLYVDGFNSAMLDWTRVGSAPYLQAIDYSSNYVYTDKNNYVIGDFSFADSGKSTETITTITVQAYARQSATNNPLQLFVWTGSAWITLGLQDIPNSWGWVNWTATTQLNSWSKIDGAKIYLQSTTGAATFEMDCARLLVEYQQSANYELDLEVQWTNVDFSQNNEWLCIYGGIMAPENLRVDYWNGTAWNNLFPALSTGWNNVSISPYLTASTFTIRFEGETEINDITQDSWGIDSVLLHVWSNQYVAQVEFTGSSNLEEWAQLYWAVDNAWSVGSVDVTIQLYNYALGNYPTSGTGWITYTSSSSPNIYENKTQTIQTDPDEFRSASGNWKLKITGFALSEFSFNVDLIGFKVNSLEGSFLTLKNEGPVTVHLVSIWVNNLTCHIRYDSDYFVNSGVTALLPRSITLPNSPYSVKVISERGNIAVYSNG